MGQSIKIKDLAPNATCRDIAREEKEYWPAARAQLDKDPKMIEEYISSRDILSLPSGEV